MTDPGVGSGLWMENWVPDPQEVAIEYNNLLQDHEVLTILVSVVLRWRSPSQVRVASAELASFLEFQGFQAKL